MNLKTIAIVVSLLTAFSGALYKAWSMETQLASISDEARKTAIRTYMWRIETKMDNVERKYDETRDDYYKRKLKDLGAEYDCLEGALDIKHKWPRDCRF